MTRRVVIEDYCGIVEKIGPEAQRFSIGDRIFGQWHILSGGPDQAGLQQFCILDADSAAPISSHHSFGQAVMFPINAIASFIALFDPSGSGFGKIVTTASVCDDSGQLLCDLGATHVIYRKAANVEVQIRAIVGGGLLYTLDTVNGDYSGGLSHPLALSLLSTTKKKTLATLVRGEADHAIAASKWRASRST
ncbi:hypothetical protein EYZ11_011948 [Aspergillus tanneri]|uniref:Uncharacterized protein n=1 Tax=Aspergillus tanneri TaxID=1220188 RepID=A0A4S3J3L7_9EURO|nr:hypothetical protein EYZ11_011948 [Aspergillus tanneri]